MTGIGIEMIHFTCLTGKFTAYFPQGDISTIHAERGSQKDALFPPDVAPGTSGPSTRGRKDGGRRRPFGRPGGYAADVFDDGEKEKDGIKGPDVPLAL